MPSTRCAELTPIDERLVEQVVRRIVEACDPEALYLFRSAAETPVQRATLTCFVVTELGDEERPYEKASKLRWLFDGWLVSFDILVQSPSDFARTQKCGTHRAHRYP